MMDDLIETVARAICQERCAFYGEPPCWKDHEEWWSTGGDCSDLTGIEGDTLASDVGCRALAKAAVCAMPRAALESENARLRMILAAQDAYERGEPSQPPVTGIEPKPLTPEARHD